MCLVGGVTTVRDCGDRDLLTLQVRDAIANGWASGPRVLTAGPPLTRSDGHLAWCGYRVETACEIRDAVRRLCDAGVDWIKVVASGGNMTPGSRPFDPSFSIVELRAASEEAHKHGRRVAVHALNAEAIRRSITAGVDTIEHCLWNGLDGRSAFDVDAACDLVQRGIFVGVNMAGIDRILLSEFAPDAAAAAVRRDKLRARWAAARQMLALGANVMLSSDAGTRYARFEDFGLTLACAVEALDLTPIEAIHRASLVPAQALGIEEKVGSVEVGKRADLLIVEGDPSRSTKDIQRVHEVWRDGRRVACADVVARPAEVSIVVPEADLA